MGNTSDITYLFNHDSGADTPGTAKAVKVSTGNAVSIVELAHPLYKSLHDALGGYFEIVRPRGISQPYCMIVDETGLLKNLPVNIVGSFIYGTHLHGSPIVGDIYIMREEMTYEGSDLAGLSEHAANLLMQKILKIFPQTKREPAPGATGTDSSCADGKHQTNDSTAAHGCQL